MLTATSMLPGTTPTLLFFTRRFLLSYFFGPFPVLTGDNPCSVERHTYYRFI